MAPAGRFRAVLQLRVRPGSFAELADAYGMREEMERGWEALVPEEEMEWRLAAAQDVQVVGLVLKQLRPDHPVLFHGCNSRSACRTLQAFGEQHCFYASARPETPRKRSRADDVETRVAKARSLCASEVAARARTLMQAHYQEFCDEKIDGAELERRRAAAREQAEKEHPPLSALDKAFAAYTAAAAAEQAAEATLEAALRALEKKGDAGPSGVKAEA